MDIQKTHIDAIHVLLDAAEVRAAQWQAHADGKPIKIDEFYEADSDEAAWLAETQYQAIKQIYTFLRKIKEH